MGLLAGSLEPPLGPQSVGHTCGLALGYLPV
jgi:hypothetical protein